MNNIHVSAVFSLSFFIAVLPIIWDAIGWSLDRMKVVGSKALREYFEGDQRPRIKTTVGDGLKTNDCETKLLVEDLESYFEFAEMVNRITRYHILLLISVWFYIIEFQHSFWPSIDWHLAGLVFIGGSLIFFWISLWKHWYLPSDGRLLFFPRVWIIVLFVLVIAFEALERLAERGGTSDAGVVLLIPA